MFHKLGSTFQIKFLVLGDSLERIEGATPVCRVINDADKKYWTGSVWQTESALLPMADIGNGVYVHEMDFTSAGDYTVHCDDDVNGCHDTMGVQVYESSDRTIYAAVSKAYTAKFLVVNEEGLRVDDALPKMTLRRDDTSEYWTGTEWTQDYADISMTLFGEGVYIYTFVPQETGTYTATCFDETYASADAFSLDVVDLSVMATSSPLISANSSNILAGDGTNSVVKDADGNPVSGVLVSAYDEGNILSARCVNIYDGTWQMYLAAGKYRFEFKKDGYMPVALERTVE